MVFGSGLTVPALESSGVPPVLQPYVAPTRRDLMEWLPAMLIAFCSALNGGEIPSALQSLPERGPPADFVRKHGLPAALYVSGMLTERIGLRTSDENCSPPVRWKMNSSNRLEFDLHLPSGVGNLDLMYAGILLYAIATAESRDRDILLAVDRPPEVDLAHSKKLMDDLEFYAHPFPLRKANRGIDRKSDGSDSWWDLPIQ